MDGWMEVKAVLRIAYSNQKSFLSNKPYPGALFLKLLIGLKPCEY
jgi:hypothetical protein